MQWKSESSDHHDVARPDRVHIILQSVSTVAFQLDDRLCDTVWNDAWNASAIRFSFEHAMASQLRRGTYTRLLWHCHR